jgi:hypothetical protein
MGWHEGVKPKDYWCRKSKLFPTDMGKVVTDLWLRISQIFLIQLHGTSRKEFDEIAEVRKNGPT